MRHAQFVSAHAVWEEPPEDDCGLEPCLECSGTREIDGEPCFACKGSDGEAKGYFLGENPVSPKEFQALAEDRYYY
jgi:hypothetical protein